MVHNSHTVGAVRITQSTEAVNRAVRNATLEVALLTGVVLLLGIGVAALIAQRLARPIRRLDRAARRVADGRARTTVEVEGAPEQRSLARAFNQMTAADPPRLCVGSRTSSPMPRISCGLR